MNCETSSVCADTNLRIYRAPEVASHYAALDYISPAERLLFENYIKPGSAILDLGVGGGRTTSFLTGRSSRYVGVDYSAEMVRACQSRFPDLEFVVADASDLSQFRDSSFDVVTFAFNGIDYIVPAEAREAAVAHIGRLLKPGGVLIFSSHNPRAIVVRSRWNQERVRKMAKRFPTLLKGPVLVAITCARAGLAFTYSFGSTFGRSAKRLLSRTFWNGDGYLVDPVHGGLVTCYRTPERVIDEMVSLGFRVERVLGDDYPHTSHLYLTDWYYYVFVKLGIG